MHRVTVSACPSCEEGWDHCHGVLLVHLDGTDECTQGPACPGGAVPHEWREPCWQLVDRCCGAAFAGAPAAAPGPASTSAPPAAAAVAAA